MIELLTICTGNVCRSPLAEVLLRSRIDSTQVTLSSAGTRARAGEPMPRPAIEIVDEHCGPRSGAGVDARRHRAILLREAMVERADLVLTMTRQHRRQAVQLAPARLRATFTVREFARLAQGLRLDLLEEDLAGVAGPAARLQRCLTLVAARRGVVDPPVEPDVDDVVDPYGRSSEVYELTARQLFPALDVVAGVVSVALGEGRSINRG